ncbi:DUF4129 domain-containing protein [Azotobacter salinestris]|uniref:DUF4129 domain-containing protein n=1 Tax=Azotobacter salinestris TaxID=69964 RepID=UPI0032DED507
MRLSDSVAALRPRSPWEAMDFGMLLAQRHAGLLMLAWAIPALPLLALLSLLLWESPAWALLIFWWLKPLGERLPLFILSRALFGETPRLGESLRALPGLLRTEWLASLTRRRLNPTRSFDLPVLLLEGLGDKELQQRRAVLAARRGKRGAGWLTLVGLHLELALWLGLLAFLYLLLPAQAGIELDWQQLLEDTPPDRLWLEHLTNGLYALVLMIWEPLYVAGGFGLYLNRRVHLEAWDLEAAFQRLRRRLGSATGILLLATGLVLAQLPGPAMAEPTASQPSQTLGRQAARADIRAMLGQPPFSRREETTRWRFGDPAQVSDIESQPAVSADFIQRLAQALEMLLWLAVGSGAMLLAWRYRAWLAVFTGRRAPAGRRVPPRPPGHSAPRPAASPTLPADIATQAERLWAEDPGQALALLYRGLLERLREDYQLPLSEADTEGEILRRIRRLERPELQHLAETLIRHWQNFAYGRHLPPAAVKDELLSAWRARFGSGSSA